MAPGEAAGKESVVRAQLPESVGAVVQVRIGDLTMEKVDCIVNAANSSLDHAGVFIDGAPFLPAVCSSYVAAGLAGAIVRNGGKIIQQESDKYVMTHGRLNEADVVATTAGALPCKARCDFLNSSEFRSDILSVESVPCRGSHLEGWQAWRG